MKCWPASLAVLCVVGALNSVSFSQQAPEPRPQPRDQRQNPPPGDAGRPDPGRDGGGRAEGGVGRPDGLGRPDGMRPGPDGRPRLPDGITPEMMRRFIEARAIGTGGGQLDAMRNYLDVFDRYTRLSRDPAAAGVAAVVTAGEILRARGADTAIAYFNKVMPDVKNDAVQRAIRLQLIELYKMSGQQDKALEQLQALMTSAPAGGIGPVGDGEGRARPKE